MEYIPPVYRRWPALEKIGFFVLVLALVADWHFQSAINKRQIQDLIAANNWIAMLSLRHRGYGRTETSALLLSNLSLSKRWQLLRAHQTDGTPKFQHFRWEIADILDDSDWLNPWGESILIPSRHTDPKATSRLFNKNPIPWHRWSLYPRPIP